MPKIPQRCFCFSITRKLILQSSPEVRASCLASCMREWSRNQSAFQTALMESSCLNPSSFSTPAAPFPGVMGIAFCGLSSVKCVVSQLLFAARLCLAFLGLLNHFNTLTIHFKSPKILLLLGLLLMGLC